jgi:hypothetical protein
MSKPPPAPPGNRSPKGTGEDKSAQKDTPQADPAHQNPGQQGQQGNVKQNTTHQGYQQDR